MYTKVYGHYPLGFRRVLRPGERKLDSDPDGAVVNQYLKWQQDRAGIRSWASYEEGIKLAIQLFGDFHKWATEQQSNPELGRHAFDFIQETIRFINTGKRQVNLHTHASLILMDVESFSTYPPADRKVRLVDLLEASSETVIAHWLRQDGGYSDMLCSLNVFFGNTRATGALTWGS